MSLLQKLRQNAMVYSLFSRNYINMKKSNSITRGMAIFQKEKKITQRYSPHVMLSIYYKT